MKMTINIIKGNNYLYLEHSYRNSSNQIIKKRKYLGKEIPSNIEQIKKEFMHEIHKEIWYRPLNNIQSNFSKEFSKLPSIAKKKYIENFLIRITYDSNKIEGSTITLRETTKLLLDGITPRNKPLKDIKETETHKLVFENMLQEQSNLSLALILRWHKHLFASIDDEIAGKIRTHEVAIVGSKFEPPQPNELNYLLRKFIQWYNNNKNISHPVELAAIAHLKFVTIHPFTDGNGRISRIIMNFILHKNKFPLLNITNKGKNNYYVALERSQTKENEMTFTKHIIKRYLKEYGKYIFQ